MDFVISIITETVDWAGGKRISSTEDGTSTGKPTIRSSFFTPGSIEVLRLLLSFNDER
jgi:hypothetical protein